MQTIKIYRNVPFVICILSNTSIIEGVAINGDMLNTPNQFILQQIIQRMKDYLITSTNVHIPVLTNELCPIIQPPTIICNKCFLWKWYFFFKTIIVFSTLSIQDLDMFESIIFLIFCLINFNQQPTFDQFHSSAIIKPMALMPHIKCLFVS